MMSKCHIHTVRALQAIALNRLWVPQKFDPSGEEYESVLVSNGVCQGKCTLGPQRSTRRPKSRREDLRHGVQEMMLMLTETFKKYVEDGRKLIEPAAVMELVEEQKLENNPLARFISLSVQKKKGVITHVHHLKARYLNWLTEVTVNGKPAKDMEISTQNSGNDYRTWGGRWMPES